MRQVYFICILTPVNLQLVVHYIIVQNGKPKLIAYASKRLPEAAKSYSITELELCGLAIHIASFSHLLKRVDFGAIVDHLALMHIIQSKYGTSDHKDKEIIGTNQFSLL